MDGFKKRVKDSLQIRLSFWLSLAILSVALIAGIFAFFSAFNEAHELQDDVLRQVAMLFDRHGLTVPQAGQFRYRSRQRSRITCLYTTTLYDPAKQSK